jgi:nitrite reductase/ring-hydroxylating ferredoxin subunit
MSAEPLAQGPRFPDGRPANEQPAWRDDFPIDWPEDHYVARRDYTKFMVLTSLAFACGQLWIGFKSLMRRGRMKAPSRVAIARMDDVPVGGVRMFQYPGPENACLLLRTDETTLVAYGQDCTHLSCAVVPRLDRGELHCPCHVGAFDVATGRPIAGPPRRPLPRIALEVRGRVIYATGIEERMT